MLDEGRVMFEKEMSEREVLGGGTYIPMYATRSPFLTFVTPSPTASTMPAPSRPSVNGICGAGYNPDRKYLSHQPNHSQPQNTPNKYPNKHYWKGIHTYR